MWGPNFVYIGSVPTSPSYDSLYTPGLNVTPAIIQQRKLMDGFMINSPYEQIDSVAYSALNAKFLAATGIVPQNTNYFQNDCLLAIVAGYNRLLSQGVTLAQILTRTIPNYNQSNFLNFNASSATGSLVFDVNGDRPGQFLFTSVSNGMKVPVLSVNTLGNFSIIGNGPIYATGSLAVPVDGTVYTELNFDPRQAGIIILMIVVVVGAFLSLLGIVLIYKYRTWDSVKVVSPPITILVALGLILSFVSNVSQIGTRVTKAQCLTHIYTSNLGITSVITFIILKAYKIYKSSDSRRAASKSNELILVAKGFFVIALQAALIVVIDNYFTSNPTLVTLDISAQYYTECKRVVKNGGIPILIYEFILLLIANFLAYKIRHAHSGFNDSKFIRLSVQNMLITNVISRFVQYSFGDDAFFLRFYVREYILAYSSLFIFSCLIARPILRAIIGSNVEISREGNINPSMIASSMNGKASAAIVSSTEQATPTQKSIVYVRDESSIFSKWNTSIIYQDMEGITLTPLKRVDANDETSERIKGIGLYFCKGTFKVYLHSRLEDSLSIVIDRKSYSVQFDDVQESALWKVGLSVQPSSRMTKSKTSANGKSAVVESTISAPK